MSTRWIVIANTINAKIFASDSKSPKHLTLVNELTHPEGLKRNQDLISDRPGHYKTSHTARGSYGEQDAKEIENDKFAMRIATFLEEARNQNQFQALTLVAGPHFFGLLEKHFSKPLMNAVDQIIQKNIVRMTEREIIKIIARE